MHQTLKPDDEDNEENKWTKVQSFEDKYPLDPLGDHRMNFLLAAARNGHVDATADLTLETGELTQAQTESFKQIAKIDLDALYQDTLEQVEKEREALPDNCSVQWAEEWRQHNLGSTLEEQTNRLQSDLMKLDLLNPTVDWNQFPEESAAYDYRTAPRTLRAQVQTLDPVRQRAFLEKLLDQGRINEEEFRDLLS
jgi:hypothetical protein